MGTSKKIIMSFLLCALAFVTVGCSCSKSVNVEQIIWEEEYIELVVGEYYDLDAKVLPDNASNQALYYSEDGATVNNNGRDYILNIGKGQILGLHAGEAVVTAMSRENMKIKADIKVRVFDKELTLDAPSGLNYNTITRRIEWAPVTYGNGYEPSGYVVTLNGVEMPITKNTYFDDFESGVTNVVSVKAIGGSRVIHDSADSSSVTFKRLVAPTDLVREGTIISWSAVDGAESYTIRVNGEVIKTNITDLSCEVDFDIAGNYAVTVEAVPNTSEDKTIYSSLPSDSISIVKLNEISELSVDDSIMRWNEVVGAVEYNAVFEAGDTRIVKSTGVNVFIDLNTVTEIPSGEVKASVIAVNNTSSGYDSENTVSIEFTKLGIPNNAQIVDNVLVFSTSENATNYMISVNGEVQAVSKDGYTLPEGAVSGEYVFKFMAVGDGETIINSNWTTDADAFIATKLKAPSEITHDNDTITVRAESGVVAYEVMDTEASDNNIYLFDNIVTADNKDTFDFYVNDKAQSSLEASKNHYNLVVKAKGKNGGNNFDSDYSKGSISFYKLTRPASFSFARNGAGFVFSWAVSEGVSQSDYANIFFPAVKMYIPDAYGNQQPFWYSYFTIFDMDGNVLFNRELQSPNEELNPTKELQNVGGGELKIAVATIGNGNSVITSSYSEFIIGRRMYEPENMIVNGTSLEFSTSGDYDDSIYNIVLLEGEGDDVTETLLGTSTIKSFDLNSFIVDDAPFEFVSGKEYNLKLYTNGVPAENSPFYASRESFITIQRLATPNAVVNGSYLEWGKVENATDYEVFVDGERLETTIESVDDSTFRAFINSDSGDHKIKVRAISTAVNNIFINSLDSEEIEFTRLEVNGLKIENNTLSFDEIDGATYRLEVFTPVSSKIINTATITEASYDLRWFNLLGGSYNVRVIATKDEFVDSGEGKFIGFNVLGTTSIKHDGVATNSIISWQTVSFAKGYKLAIERTINGGTFVDYTDIITKTTYDLSSKEVVGGVITKITIRAIGDGVKYIDSVYFDSENPFNFEKLATPTDLTGLVGEDMFTLSWSATNGAKYEVYIDGVFESEVLTNEFGYALTNFDEARDYVFTVRAVSVDNSKPSSSISEDYVVTKFKETTGLKVEDNSLVWDYTANTDYTVKIFSADNELVKEVIIQSSSYDLTILSTGSYKAEVVTEGNGKNTIGGEVTTVDNIVVLGGTTGIKLDAEERVLVWNAVENNKNGYAVIYRKGDTIIRQVVKDNFTTTPNSVTEGEWIVGVKVAGNGSNEIDSPISEVISIIKQPSVSNIVFNKGILTFDAVTGVDNYRIVVSGAGNVEKEVVYQSSGVTLTFESVGEYVVSVFTLGDYVNTVDSNASSVGEIIKLAQVQNLSIYKNVLNWSEMTLATSYKVKVGENIYDTETNSFDLTTLNLEKGDYSVQVKAVNDSALILDSEYASLGNQITVLGAVENVQIVDNAQITFDTTNVGSATGYRVYYVGSETFDEFFASGTEVDLLTTLPSGDYDIYIVSVGNNQYIVNSKPSAYININKPVNQSIVTHKSGVITVTVTGEYQNYIVSIVHNGISDYKYLTVPNLAINYDFASVGEYSISACIKGDSSTFINSDYSTPIVVTKINTVTGLKVKDNKVIFDENEIVKNNDFNYEIVFVGTDSKTFTTKETNFEISEELMADTFEVKVRCLAGDEVDYLPSDFVSVQNIVKLNAPIISDVLTNNKLVWTASQAGITGYEVRVVGETTTYVTINDVTIKEFELGDEFSAGNYAVSVRALGDGISFVKSNFSNVKNITKLDEANVIVEKQNNDSTSDYVISWDAIKNATGYNVLVNNGVIYTTETFISIDKLNAVYIGRNSARVVAIGDNNSFVNSKKSNDVMFTITSGDEISMRIASGKLVWSGISGAVVYVLDINGTIVNVGMVNEYSLGDEFNGGDYSIKIKAYLNNPSGQSVVVNTLFSSAVQGYKLARPSSPSITNGTFVLNLIEYKTPEADDGEEALSPTKILEYEYGTTHGGLDVSKLDETVLYLLIDVYSNKVGEKANFRYRALGDDFNLTSDWSDAVNPTYGEQLSNPANVNMKDGLLSWDKVDGASGYVIVTTYKYEDESGEVKVVNKYISTDKTNYYKPFAELLGDTTITLSIAIYAVGDSYYTNSELSDIKQITYLAKPNNFATDKGTLTWNGGVNSYEITIDNTKTIILNNSNTYDFASEECGERSIKVKALGDGGFIVDSEYSDVQKIVKLGAPNLATSMLENGKLKFTTSAGFAKDITDVITGINKALGNIKIYTKYNGVLSEGQEDSNRELILDYFDVCDMSEEGELYNQLVNVYFDGLQAGAYTFKIANLGNSMDLKNGIGYITSNYCGEFNVEILKRTSDINIIDGILSWKNVENNNGYELFIGQGAQSTLKKVDLGVNVTSYDLNALDLTPDEYALYVRARGDSSIYLTSNTSAKLDILVLEIPKAGDFAFTIVDGKIAWNRVTGAVNYVVKVVNIENGETFEYTDVVFDDTDEVITYRLPEELNAGTYRLCLKALGDGTESLDSKFGEEGLVTKLETLSKLGNYLGKLQWEVAYFDSGTMIDRYEISMVGLTNGEEYDFIVSNVNGDYKITDGYCLYELSEDIVAGEYNITIRAVGEVVTESSVRTLYASGSASNAMKATRLGAPTAVYVENGIIKWDYVGSDYEGFYLVVDNKTYEDVLITVQQSEFRDDNVSGAHYLAVKVVGNTVAYNQTGVRLLTSSAKGNKLTIKKLDMVENILINKGILYFDGVANASEYEVVATIGDNVVKARTNDFDVDANMYKFELIGESYPQGEYSNIKVRAIGDNFYVNSSYSTFEYKFEENIYTNVFKLSTPNQVTLEVVKVEQSDVLFIRWQSVEYTFNGGTIVTNKYRIKLVGEYNYLKYFDVEVGEGDEVEGLTGAVYYQKNLNELLGTLPTGAYKISLQAVPLPIAQNVFNALSSEYTSESQVTNPDTPSNVRFDTSLKAFAWDEPMSTSGVTLQYEVFYLYRSTLGSKISIGKTVVDSPIFYPQDLGVYNITVRTIVSGSLASKYIGENNREPGLKVQYVGTGDEDYLTNLDKLEFVTEDGVISYYLDEQKVSILGMDNSVVGTHDLFAGGNGSVANPYKIATVEQFARINFYYGSEFYFVQVANLDFGGEAYSVGSAEKPFSGVYDGANFSITNLKLVASETNVGLFRVTNGATIRNIILKNSSMSINRIELTNAGFIVGKAINTRVLDTTVTSSTISIDFASGNSTTYYVGGIVGIATGDSSVLIQGCYNSSNITRSSSTNNALMLYSGGIVGSITTVEDLGLGIQKCGNAGNIAGTYVGGLAGVANCMIGNSYNLGAITGEYATNMKPCAGGLFGGKNKNVSTVYQVVNCYNTGNVTSKAKINGDSCAGGLAGEANITVENFYNSGTVTATSWGTETSSKQVKGWIVGSASGTISVSKVYTTVSSPASPVGSGKSDGEFKIMTSTELNANVSTYLGEAFEYSASHGRVILKIEK